MRLLVSCGAVFLLLLAVSVSGAQFPDPGALPSEKAEEILETRCALCHPLSLPMEECKDWCGWARTVRRMSEKSPHWLAEDEIQAIVEYLALHRGTVLSDRR